MSNADVHLVDIPPGQPQLLAPAHNRLCYYREVKQWRVRDEDSGELRLVDDYEGDLNLNWMDGGSHVFHDGPYVIDRELKAHFFETMEEAEAFYLPLLDEYAADVRAEQTREPIA